MGQSLKQSSFASEDLKKEAGRRYFYVALSLYQVLLLSLFVGFTAPVSGAEILFDRVLFKINDASFTQREMEIYLLVKALQLSQNELIATEKNWQSALLNYKNAMLIYEESKKLHLSTEQVGLDKQVLALRTMILNDKALNMLGDRLGIDDKDIELTLHISARVEKAKNVQKESLNDSLGIPPAKKVPILDRKNFVRIFDDAEIYRLIQPKAFLLARPTTK